MGDKVKDYPPYLDYPKERKPQTNADRIRAMTDEELARFLCAYTYGCEKCAAEKFCGEGHNGWLKWLKQERCE